MLVNIDLEFIFPEEACDISVCFVFLFGRAIFNIHYD